MREEREEGVFSLIPHPSSLRNHVRGDFCPLHISPGHAYDRRIKARSFRAVLVRGIGVGVAGACLMAVTTSFKQRGASGEAMVPIGDPGLIGRKIDCPKCKYRFVVEDPGTGAEAEPAKKAGPTA